MCDKHLVTDTKYKVYLLHLKECIQQQEIFTYGHSIILLDIDESLKNRIGSGKMAVILYLQYTNIQYVDPVLRDSRLEISILSRL